MSELNPSFRTLYMQARPFHPSGKPMEQYERFATACLGFALQHDPSFRKDFLQTICGYGVPKPEEFEVSLEIPNCGDLALTSEKMRFVIEAKVNAPLEDNQNPSKSQFYELGYGHGILKSPHLKNTYIVLWQEDTSLVSLDPRKLPFAVRLWNDLLGVPVLERPIVDDLFKSLASFGIRCFAIRNPMTDKLKLASKSNDACRVHGVLRDVANYLEELGLPNKKDSSEFDSTGGSYIGWDLTRRSWDSAHKKKADSKWVNYVNSKPGSDHDEISWFGYSDGKLNVGFYCEPRRVKAVRSSLEQRAAAGYGEVSIDAAYIWIASKDGGPAKGDKEWFRAIYDHVNNDIDHQRSVRPAPAA